jgi:hypothetical protein
MENKILVVAKVISSKPDINGNRYSFAIFTRTCDGATASTPVDSADNVDYVLSSHFGGWDRILVIKSIEPIREFNRAISHVNACYHTDKELIDGIISQWDDVS